ncbi:MAG TPA: flagellin [Candidatus Mucispirillum faecigallinarum]|uniref:Flagellin n=1 Tax=Candidatus Mucispirillum faecigallinarum TaxID=2838699 RepID=A0A9D2GW00_9BACT|nr:flagellin [Candidatus Mucispirillum faecigallinarum]
MALSIYNNVTSLGAQRYLNIGNNAQTKSLQRLSSGLRINTAADDASGLAISEKLRGQISGMKRASMNAQDGISYLQTAEGAMASVTSMLQRMRELAVQAGNGTYTTNDREMLQLEVDQLKDEINRISQTSEFNTKKLLDGSGTALWSSTENYLGAVVKGPAAAEGNYKVDTSVQPGQNNVYKSQIMQVNNGVLVAEVTSTTNNPTVTSVRDPKNIPVTNNEDMVITVKGETATIDDGSNSTHTLSAMQTYHGAEGSQSTWKVSSATYTNNDNAMSGYYEVEIVDTTDGTVTGGFTYRYRYMDSKTGEMSAWAAGTAAAAITATISLTIGGANGANQATMELKLPGANSTIQPGDKIVSIFDANSNTFQGAASGSGSLQIDNGPILTFSAAGSLVKADNGDEKINYNDIDYHIATMDPKTGVISYGSLTVEFREGAAGVITPTAGQLVSGTTTVNVRDSGPATKDTKLSNISQFTNADGVNILANTQELTIYNQGKSTTIYLEQDDTIEDFDKKLTDALMKLGLGADESTSNGRTINESLVRYVSQEGVANSDSYKATASTNEAVPGTFVIQTAALGIDSELVFTGDQNLMNALGLATIQKGVNSSIDVTVTDAHSGKFVGSDNINDGKARNIIEGIDITIEQDAGVEPVWNDNTKSFEFNATNEVSTAYLHVVDNRTELQIGANEGQTLNISVGQLDTTGLEIDDVYVMDMELSQRSITKIDKALEILSATRATVGAQMNRLEYTISNLDTARENLTAAESRIRDLDIAEETTNLTKNQILVQSATSMVAQANKIPQQALALLQSIG